MPLIVDVEMNNGDDTAFYVHRGHSVVAIEAAPKLAKAAASRFHSEVDDGRLKILNVAVAQCSGEVDLWICPSAARPFEPIPFASESKGVLGMLSWRAGYNVTNMRILLLNLDDLSTEQVKQALAGQGYEITAGRSLAVDEILQLSPEVLITEATPSEHPRLWRRRCHLLPV